MTDRIADRPLSRPEALRIIRRLAVDSANVTFVRHAQQRQVERRIDHWRIMAVLQKGVIVEGPALDPKGLWRCTLRRFAAGESINVVVAIGDDELIVVTAF